MTISLCVPTRRRPERFAAMLASARATASQSFEVIAWRDEDDPTVYPVEAEVTYAAGPRPFVDGALCTSGLWTKAWELATGEIAMLGADDIIFRTPGWDTRVEAEFARFADRILMAYPDDGTSRQAPVNPFVSREWIEAAGFTPPDWQGWFSDEWVWAIAAELRRVAFMADVRITHERRRGSDVVYRDGERARKAAGGLAGMKSRFYSLPLTRERDEKVAALRERMGPGQIVPDPLPGWFTESIDLAERARSTTSRTADTLVVVHAYAGDAALVEAFLPQYRHHDCDVLVLSPEDAPVVIEGVECRSAGKRGYYGQDSLDRQREHLRILLEYPHRWFLLNDSDSMCLSPQIPAYLYESGDVVWSNEVREYRPHASPYPKIALQPPYFLTRGAIERMLAVGPIEAHPITPFVDWMMLALVCEAGLEHRSYPDGRSFPAWRHTHIPETKELGHDYTHVQESRGIDGAKRMSQQVLRGAVMVHSIKHPPVRDQLLAARQRYERTTRRR